MKVTIITLQNVRNYGSVLQALATQEVFRRLGHRVEFVNYRRADMTTPLKRAEKWCRNRSLFQKVFFTLVLYPTFLLQDKRFGKFTDHSLNVMKMPCTTEEDFARLPLTADVYCTGSDQTWNSTWNDGILAPLFLNFVPAHIRKIAYSASFGKRELAEHEKAETKKWLQRYQAISVRESSGVEIIDGLGIPGAVRVLDPTLQLDRSFWEKYAGKNKFARPYLLIYQLNADSRFDRYAKEFARRKGLKLVRFCTRIDQCVKSGKAVVVPEVPGFVSLIAHAAFVITDSFHATAFCINLNTGFLSIYPREFGGRIDSLLKLTGLESRRLTAYSDFSHIDAGPVDFTGANRILEKERQKGFDFLKQALD